MDHVSTALKNVVAASRRLAETDPQDEAVSRVVDHLQDQAGLLKSLMTQKPTPDTAPSNRGWGKDSMDNDVEFIGQQVQKLKAAAAVPMRNYQRIVSICDGLANAVVAARRPENAGVRPQIAGVVKRVAGVFAEVDTVDDLDKPLEQIEKAVHSLYGDQSKNETYYFDRRNKGHHGKE